MFLSQFGGPSALPFQAYLAQFNSHSASAPQSHSSTVVPPQDSQPKKPSKGIKSYPDGWQKLLNIAKDVVRGSVLIKHPFPSPSLTRITANESFHEVQASECANGLILEPGTPPLMNLRVTPLLIRTNRILVVRPNGTNCKR